MKKLLFTCFLALLVSTILAQGSCLTTEQTLLEMERDATFAGGMEAFQVLSEAFEHGTLDDASREGFKEVTIPVVVHVLYRLEENNISYDQILSQIEVLNRDFNWQQSDKDLIPEVWRDLGAAAKKIQTRGSRPRWQLHQWRYAHPNRRREHRNGGVVLPGTPRRCRSLDAAILHEYLGV